jgi:hypothetical protein
VGVAARDPSQGLASLDLGPFRPDLGRVGLAGTHVFHRWMAMYNPSAAVGAAEILAGMPQTGARVAPLIRARCCMDWDDRRAWLAKMALQGFQVLLARLGAHTLATVWLGRQIWARDLVLTSA